MRRFYFFFFTLCFLQFAVHAQYAPQAGLPGSTAISASSSLFMGWGTNCVVQRGYRCIDTPSYGYATAGNDSLATGPADGAIVSLGDSGIATVTFAYPIVDGPGADFAVFENGFLNTADATQAFLELGFVEVSSDGANYFRFPATSLTQTSVQVANGTYLDASKLNNLAGSYIALYGTPFDLHELSGIPGLDVNNITHVRIIDVVGSINGHASHDNAGNIINDPYPTPFPSSGFDLDAVGVIHATGNAGIHTMANNDEVNIYPNPAYDRIVVHTNGTIPAGWNATLMTITGSMLQQFQLLQNNNTLPIEQYPSGMYYLVINDANGNKWVEKIVKR